MPTRTITTSLQLDGEQEFKKQMSSVNNSLRTMKSEMSLLESEFKGQANSVEALTAKDKLLRQEHEQQAEKVRALEQAVKEASEAYGENDQRVDKYRQQLNNAKVELNRLDDELAKNDKYLDEAKQSADGCATSIDGYGKEVEDAGEKTSTFGDVLKANLTSEAIIAGVRALANAVKQVGESFAESISATAEYGDNIDKMSQKMGLSSNAYQEWDFIMQHCGASIDSLQSGMKTMATAAETGSEAFSKLGISQEQIAVMSQEDLFAATIAALQNVTDETERTYLAGQLLGRGATELGPLLNMSAEETEVMRQQLHDLGSVMSEDAVKAAAAYQDSLQNLQTAFTGVKNNLSGEFLPSVTLVMDGMTAMISGNVDEGVAMVEQGVKDFGDKLEELGPYAEVALNALMDVVVASLPDIVACGGEVLIALIDGLCQAMPELIPTVVDVVLTIVDTLVNNVDLLIGAAIKLAVGISVGLVRAIPQITSRLPEIISAIVTGLISAVPQIAEAGRDLIRGLWNGIEDMGRWIGEKIKGFGQGVVNSLKNFFGIHSPSTVFRDQIGVYLAKGVGEGFVAGMDDVALKMANAIPSDFDVTANLNAALRTPTVQMQQIVGNTVAYSDGGSAEVVAAIQALSAKIDHLKIYLSSGALVGGIVEDMDSALGAAYAQRERRELVYERR